MIIYNQAFDYYHAIFRMIHLLSHFQRNEFVELDRLRIWDFYLLFPDKIHEIKIKRDEKDIKELIRRFVKHRNNPYNDGLDSKKVFEKLRPYQIAALNCLASYGIINKELLSQNRVSIISPDSLAGFQVRFEELTDKEKN
ncbi:MAG: hypothetical protein EOO43_25920, partial [Flavobacterium sp.]